MGKEIVSVDKLVPDTSVIIEGLVSKELERKELKVDTIIIHEAVVAELEHQSNVNRHVGFLGLEEIERIKVVADKQGIDIQFLGSRPRPDEIRNAKLGEIDALIRQLAFDEDATLFTADRVQATVGKAKNMKILFVEIEKSTKKLPFEKFFDKKTMSLHMRENEKTIAKRGSPGSWKIVTVEKKALTHEQLRELSSMIVEEASLRPDGFIESDKRGSTIVQLGHYRTVITRPPFSDGWEITIVKPIKKLKLSDYKISQKLAKRLSQQAEGILIAGPPGHGKSTLAMALAEHFASLKKIVKTIESPRDLMLSESITQYSIPNNVQELQDVLLLNRPDYTIFDEMRNTQDFKLYSDLRLSGIGLAGVIHATHPIEAIHRFMGRVELGVIPQVVDTVLFVANGAIEKALSVRMTVKVPEGMTEADLARPVVVVEDFESEIPEFEVYTYGEQTVVIPLTSSKNPLRKLAEKQLQEELSKKYECTVDVVSDRKCIIHVPAESVKELLAHGAAEVRKLERKFGLAIEVQTLSSKRVKNETPIKYHAEKQGSNVIIDVGSSNFGKSVRIYINNDFIVTTKVGKSGAIKISTKSAIGTQIASNLKKLSVRI